jgi:hypothetical protein
MGFLGRLFKASNAFTGRTKVGSLQGGLKYNLKDSGVDAPRSQEFITRLTAEAWSIRLVSEFFQGLGFSLRDYDVMYRAAVRECPDVLIEGRNLVATFLLVDNCQQFLEGFQAFAKAVADTTGAAREDTLSTLIASTVRDIAAAHPSARPSV